MVEHLRAKRKDLGEDGKPKSEPKAKAVKGPKTPISPEESARVAALSPEELLAELGL